MQLFLLAEKYCILPSGPMCAQGSQAHISSLVPMSRLAGLLFEYGISNNDTYVNHFLILFCEFNDILDRNGC